MKKSIIGVVTLATPLLNRACFAVYICSPTYVMPAFQKIEAIVFNAADFARNIFRHYFSQWVGAFPYPFAKFVSFHK